MHQRIMFVTTLCAAVATVAVAPQVQAEASRTVSDIVIVDEHDPYVNPIGAKGLGEISMTGVAAAVANAVHHATGVRVRDLPITLDKLLVRRA